MDKDALISRLSIELYEAKDKIKELEDERLDANECISSLNIGIDNIQRAVGHKGSWVDLPKVIKEKLDGLK